LEPHTSYLGSNIPMQCNWVENSTS